MAASGLTTHTNHPDKEHVAAVADYAFTIRKQLQNVNENSWNNFKLRIGENCCVFLCVDISQVMTLSRAELDLCEVCAL